jgi:hypothetical protein
MPYYLFIFITLQAAQGPRKMQRWRSDFLSLFTIWSVFAAQILRHLTDFVKVEYSQKYFFGTSETASLGGPSTAAGWLISPPFLGSLPAGDDQACRVDR